MNDANSSTKSSNRLLLKTLTKTRQVQEAWGDRVYYTLEIATDLPDGAEKNRRIYDALRKVFPFNPTYCTNQVSAVDAVGTTATFSVYHSIGD